MCLYGLMSARQWRFVDLGRRMDHAGRVWMVPNAGAPCRRAIADGKLVVLQTEDDPTPPEGLTIYAAHRRDRALGPASRRLLYGLRQRLAIM